MTHAFSPSVRIAILLACVTGEYMIQIHATERAKHGSSTGAWAAYALGKLAVFHGQRQGNTLATRLVAETRDVS